MRRSLVVLFIFFSFCAMSQMRIVKNPPFSVRNYESLEIDSIEMNSQSTVFHMSGYSNPKYWIMIASDTYIKANGEKLMVLSAEGIELNKEQFPDESGRRVFSLTFPPIDKDLDYIDFIESDCETCFKIWGIELNSPVLTNRVEVPKNIKALAVIKDDGKPLTTPILKDGDAILKGYLLGYRPEMLSKVLIAYNNPLSGDQDEYETKVAQDGSFELKIPMLCTAQVLLRVSSPWYNKYIILTPAKETVVYFDMQQIAMNNSRTRIDKTQNVKSIYFGGANSEINNQVEDMKYPEYRGQFIDYEKILVDCGGMSANEYKKYMMDQCSAAVAGLVDKKLTRKAHDFVVHCLQYAAMDYLLMGDYFLEQAYRKSNNLGYEDPAPDYQAPIFEQDYYSFLKECNTNSPMGLYNENYSSLIGSCSRLKLGFHSTISLTQASNEAYDRIIKNERLTADELLYIKFQKQNSFNNWSAKETAEFYQYTTSNYERLIATGKLTGRNLLIAQRVLQLCNPEENNIKQILEFSYEMEMRIGREKLFGNEEFKFDPFVYSEDVGKPTEDLSPEMAEVAKGFGEKYKDIFDHLARASARKEAFQPLITVLGTDKGPLFDMITSRIYYSSIVEYKPLGKEQLLAISKIENPFYYTYFSKKNNELITLLKSRKGKKLENVYDTPEVEDDKVLHEILKPYEGKVVFIDFWATWCGPCRSAMKEFEPTKKSFEGKDVVFIYLTDESSPMALWENMVPTIDGKHFRLKDSQFSYLKKKYGVTGIPSYLIINKKGEQVYFRVGFEGAQRIGQILNDELAK